MRTLEEAESRIEQLEKYVEFLEVRLNVLVECASEEAIKEAKEIVGDE
jgi:predicted dinucleotide-utilizing enzyme